MQRMDHDYGSQNIDGDDLENQVLQDYPQLKKGLALVIFGYEDRYVVIFLGSKQELEKKAQEIFQEGSLDEHNELVFYENGIRKQPKISF